MPQVEKSRNDKVKVTRRDQVKVTHPITTAVYTQLLMTLCITRPGATNAGRALGQRVHVNGEKQRLKVRTQVACGVEINGLAGLYCYFLGLSHAWMANGGLAGWFHP